MPGRPKATPKKNTRRIVQMLPKRVPDHNPRSTLNECHASRVAIVGRGSNTDKPVPVWKVWDGSGGQPSVFSTPDNLLLRDEPGLSALNIARTAYGLY